METDTQILTNIDTVETPEAKVDEHISQLVGEGKKYANVDALAKAYLNADGFIETLKKEKRDIEAERDMLKTSRKTIEEVIEAVRQPQTIQREDGKVETASIKPEDVKSLVDQEFARRSAEARAEEAKKVVWTKLSEVFGDEAKAKAAIKSYAGDDKARLKLLDTMALTDLDGMVKILKDHTPVEETVVSPTQHPQRLTSEEVPQGLTWSKCEKLRKDNPKMYHSRAFQVEMHKQSVMNPNFFNK